MSDKSILAAADHIARCNAAHEKYVTMSISAASQVQKVLEEIVQLADNIEKLHRFINAAAGEGLVLDGVDAADLYIALFPDRYKAALETNETGTSPPSA